MGLKSFFSEFVQSGRDRHRHRQLDTRLLCRQWIILRAMFCIGTGAVDRLGPQFSYIEYINGHNLLSKYFIQNHFSLRSCILHRQLSACRNSWFTFPIRIQIYGWFLRPILTRKTCHTIIKNRNNRHHTASFTARVMLKSKSSMMRIGLFNRELNGFTKVLACIPWREPQDWRYWRLMIWSYEYFFFFSDGNNMMCPTEASRHPETYSPRHDVVSIAVS